MSRTLEAPTSGEESMKFHLIMIIAALALTPAYGCSGGDDAKSTKSASKKDKKAKKKKKKKKGYEGGEVANGGSIKGVISTTKEVADKMEKGLDKDENCVTDGITERKAGALVVAEGKVANAIVYIAKIKKGKAYTASDVTVDNNGCRYVPRVSIGHKKAQLLTTNSDPTAHNVNVKLPGGNVFNKALPKAKKASVKLKKAGYTKISCDMHPWMEAHMMVLDNPYGVLTAADGSYDLTDVPAGDYTVKVWHELLGESESKVTVKAGEATAADITL